MMFNIFDLSNKTILITGGAGYLGTAMSEILSAYNANLVIASRDQQKCQNLADKLNKKYGNHSFATTLDISSKDSIKNCIKEVLDKTGRIDVLINNAAFSVAGYFEDLTETTWQKAIDGTINSVFRMCSEVIPYMVKQQSGNIINIASMYGLISPDPNIYRNPDTHQDDVKLNNPACYGAGKAAILQLTKYLAGYYGEKGIRCNSISPGPFPSPSVQESSWFIENLAKKTMLKRIGQPKDLEGVILFLASDASSYVTGTNICVDGGWTAW